MNKAQAKLVRQVARIDEEWADATPERKGELLEERGALLGRSDVQEALGVAAAERQSKRDVASRASRRRRRNARARCNMAGAYALA